MPQKWLLKKRLISHFYKNIKNKNFRNFIQKQACQACPNSDNLGKNYPIFYFVSDF